MTLIRASRPNAYTGSPLDRVGEKRNDEAWLADAFGRADGIYVLVWRARSLLRGLTEAKPEAVYLSAAEATPWRTGDTPWAFLGVLGERPVFALDVSAVEEPLGLIGGGQSFEDLRATAGSLPPDQGSVLAHARGLMHWRSRHRFCGICGCACLPASAGHVMICSGCKTHHFPRTDPAVIMLVTRGQKVLLGHSQRFPKVTMYSTLAGFVEPGESLEEAVAREVYEESQVRVGDVTYHSSQPWPFPSSIMLGFYAEGLTEEITIDPGELRDARWFSREELLAPEANGFSLPRADSIARRLIEDWLAAGGAVPG